MKKLYFGMFVLVFVFLAYWLLFTLGSNSKQHDALRSDSEVLFVLCSMVKTDISSARITENTIMLRQSFEKVSPVFLEEKKEFVISALASAEEGAEMYNSITSQYSKEQIANYNLPYTLETVVDTNTVVKCTNKK